MTKGTVHPIYASLGPSRRRMSVPCTQGEVSSLLDLARDRGFEDPREFARVLIREALARAGKMPMDGVEANVPVNPRVQTAAYEFLELYFLYEVKLWDNRDETEHARMIAAGNFDEAVSAAKEYFALSYDGARDVVGVMEMGDLAFVVGEK